VIYPQHRRSDTANGTARLLVDGVDRKRPIEHELA